jgi:hypothetical protein
MPRNDDQTKTGRATVRRVTVAEAARMLNLSAEAVRSRVQRGTLDSIKVDGTVYVLLDADRAQQNTFEADNQTLLIQSLRALMHSLRDQASLPAQAARPGAQSQPRQPAHHRRAHTADTPTARAAGTHGVAGTTFVVA